jgi:flagellar protein FliO/FliZ
MIVSRALLVAVAVPATALAAEADPGPGLMQGLLQTTLGLALVLALIWGAAWAIRRVSPAAGRPNALLRNVATLAVGQRERVVIVEVGEQWLVLGVTASAISALSALPKGAMPAAPDPSSFAGLLTRAQGRRSAP